MHQFLTHFELNSKLNSVNWKENSVKTRWLCREGMDSFYISQKQRSFHWRCAAFFLCYSFFLKLRSQIHLWLHQVHEHIPRNEGVFYEVIHVEACRQYMLSTKTELLLYCMICLSFPCVIMSSLISSSSMEQTRQWKKNRMKCPYKRTKRTGRFIHDSFCSETWNILCTLSIKLHAEWCHSLLAHMEKNELKCNHGKSVVCPFLIYGWIWSQVSVSV